ARSSAAALLTSGVLWLLVQFYPDLLARYCHVFWFNPLAWQFIFCIGMFVGTWYNSDISLEPFRTRLWVSLASTVVGVGLLYRIGHHLNLVPRSDETLWQMKENLSVIRLVHFFSVAFLVAICVRPSSPILGWPAASVIIKSGRCSL